MRNLLAGSTGANVIGSLKGEREEEASCLQRERKRECCFTNASKLNSQPIKSQHHFLIPSIGINGPVLPDVLLYKENHQKNLGFLLKSQSF